MSWVCGSFLLAAHVLAQVAICFQARRKHALPCSTDEAQFSKVFWAMIQVIAPSYVVDLWQTAAVAFAELVFSFVIVCSPLSRSAIVWRGSRASRRSSLELTCAVVYIVAVFCLIAITLLVACSDRLVCVRGA